ncbi:unnamed protein product [Prunus armeniaca]
MEGDRPRFQRIYICLAVCKKGFLDGSRTVVCLDRYYVKGPYPGGLALKHQMEAIARAKTVP